MRPTPYQTYLAERLQSAKGLGWDMDKPGVLLASVQNMAVPFWDRLFYLLRWFRFAK